MCNPPFHSSSEEAKEGTKRKWNNLGLKKGSDLNFGGKNNELWCEGGEKAFIQNMIAEREAFSSQVGWFTTLVSKEANLPSFMKLLDSKRINHKTIDMALGNKISRILCWTYTK